MNRFWRTTWLDLASRCSVLPIVLLAVACGGGGEPAEPPGASIETEGGEALPSPTADSEAASPTAVSPTPSGPSTIRFDVKVAGEPVGAEISILRGGEVVASGQAGQPITTESGDYEMAIKVTDGLVDHPVEHGQLTLEAGADVAQTIELAWARIQVQVRINGRATKSATVDVMRDGEVVATLKSGAPHVLISPGRYQAIVKARGAKMEVPELMFPSEATRTVPVSVKM